MNTKKLRSQAIDFLLLTAIVGLSAYLFWPVTETWLNRPRPGRQVYQQHTVEKISVATVNYLLYLPEKYNKQHKWPLVVFLHGAGARGRDLELVSREGLPKQVKQGKHFDFILISPQCPAGVRWSPEIIIELIEYISKSFAVDRDRVYLTGWSMGGFGTWNTAYYDSSRFAAIAPLSGGGNIEQASQLSSLPIWAFHGNKDNVVPLDASQTMVDAVRNCGGNVKFTVYPDHGHNICGVTYQDRFFDWLLAQKRGQPPTEKSSDK